MCEAQWSDADDVQRVLVHSLIFVYRTLAAVLCCVLLPAGDGQSSMDPIDGFGGFGDGQSGEWGGPGTLRCTAARITPSAVRFFPCLCRRAAVAHVRSLLC